MSAPEDLMLRNYADPDSCPLITVQLMAHDGDAHLLPRSVASIMKQTLDHDQIHLQIVFDGPPSAESDKHIEAATRDVDFWCFMLATTKKHGYYCAPRNMALPSALGLYIAHMDADNEFKPEHLETCLRALRTWEVVDGYPHFVYTQREYVIDDDMPKDQPFKLPTGPSPFTPWAPKNCAALIRGPMNNFVDTGDFVVAKSALMWVAETTGYIWNAEMRRFGDWDLVARFVAAGLRGRALEQVTHTYHWQGKNLQLTRPVTDEVNALPKDLYERYKAEGKIKETL